LRVKTDVVRLKPQTCLVQIEGRTTHEASTGSVLKQRRLVVHGVVTTSDTPDREMSTVVELKRAPRISVSLGVTAVFLQGAAEIVKAIVVPCKVNHGSARKEG